MTTLIVKITDGTDIRRFTANVADLTFESVQKRTAEAFGLGVKDLKLQYKDDEGDMVTMSSNDEMLEAIGLATSMVPAVLRLNVSKTTNNPKTTNTTTDTTTNTGGGAPPHDMNDLMQKISAQLPHLVHQLPEALRHLVPNAELDLAATVAANVNSAMTGGCHPGVTCDKTGMHPIVGNRWHLKGHDYDLCEAEYQKLAEEEKLKYELIPPPCAPPLAAGFGMGGCAGMGGMGGGRPTPADHGAVDEGGCHPGVSCDKSGMNPIVGFRYHLRGHNYDLCDAEYQKLPPKEQACFEKIAPPPKPKPFGGGGGGGFGGPAAWGTHGGGWGGRCGGGFGGGRGMHRGDGGGPKLAARFVRDVSIFDGTQMAPGTSFTKIWRIKNVGEVPWPPGTKIVFVGGDRMTSELTVPLSYHGAVAPGGEVDVAVDLVAPSELGRFVGYWRLTGPFGRRKFGQRVWCHIQVVDPHAPPAPPTELEIKNAMAIGTDDDDDDDMTDGGAADGAAAVVHPDGTAALVDGMKKAAAFVDGATKAAAGAVAAAAMEVDGATKAAAGAAAAATAGAASAVASAAAAKAGGSATKAEKEGAVAAELASMGFAEDELVAQVIEKHGPDLEACARDLAALTEWDAMLDDLQEMGFGDRSLNKKLMIKHDGSLKRTVKDLVTDGA